MKTDPRDPLTLLQNRSTTRFWDFSKPILESKVEYIKKCIQLTPTCNNECWYTVYFVTNRNIITQLVHDVTYCYEGEITDGSNKVGYPIPEEHADNPMMKRLNGQVNAPLVLVFASSRDNPSDGRVQSHFAAGIAMMAAHAKGLQTGLNNCFDTARANSVLGIKGWDIRLMMGVGYRDHYSDKCSRIVQEPGQAPAYSRDNNRPGATHDEPVGYWDSLIQTID